MFILIKSQLLKFLWATQQRSSVKSMNSSTKKPVLLNSNQPTPNIKEVNAVIRVEKNTQPKDSANDFSETYLFSEFNIMFTFISVDPSNQERKVVLPIWFSSSILTNITKNVRKMVFGCGTVTQESRSLDEDS